MTIFKWIIPIVVYTIYLYVSPTLNFSDLLYVLDWFALAFSSMLGLVPAFSVEKRMPIKIFIGFCSLIVYFIFLYYYTYIFLGFVFKQSL